MFIVSSLAFRVSRLASLIRVILTKLKSVPEKFNRMKMAALGYSDFHLIRVIGIDERETLNFKLETV